MKDLEVLLASQVLESPIDVRAKQAGDSGQETPSQAEPAGGRKVIEDGNTPVHTHDSSGLAEEGRRVWGNTQDKMQDDRGHACVAQGECDTVGENEVDPSRASDGGPLEHRGRHIDGDGPGSGWQEWHVETGSCADQQDRIRRLQVECGDTLHPKSTIEPAEQRVIDRRHPSIGAPDLS